MKTMRIFLVAALLAVSTTALALTYDNKGKLTWQFLNGKSYSTSHDSSGIPKVIDKKVTIPYDFLTRLASAIPERRDIRTTNPDLITDDFGANVHLKKEADIYLTFVHEGAGYKNSLGFFTFSDDQIPQSKADIRETIIFPNSSFNRDGGSSAGLRSGDTMKIGHFTAGTNIGFLLVADGFNSKTGVTTVPNGGPPGGDAVYYTLKHLNPETDPAMKAHTILLNDEESGFVVLGMEDLSRNLGSGCDHDFNDTIYTVTSFPADAIDVTDIAPVPGPEDRDHDGVLDDNDDHPDDPGRAFDIVNSGTFMFEDSWPVHGDYDFNDVVIRYQFLRAENKNGMVLDVIANFTLAAWGTQNHNGLAFQLPGMSPSLVQIATLTINGGTATVLTPEGGQPNLVYRLFDDQATIASPTTPCEFFNVEQGCFGDGPQVQLRISFITPRPASALGQPPWDPFLFRTDDRGHEIHLVNHAPTALADMSLFGTGSDASSPVEGRWYTSVCNLPFGLDIPEEWAWPLEGTEISTAYPKFLDWVNSSGTTSADWYKTGQVQQYLWSR